MNDFFQDLRVFACGSCFFAAAAAQSKGQFSTFDLKWNDSDKTLTISDRKGSFVGMKERMDFNIVIVTPESGTGIYQSKVNKSIVYEGKSMVISL